MKSGHITFLGTISDSSISFLGTITYTFFTFLGTIDTISKINNKYIGRNNNTIIGVV